MAGFHVRVVNGRRTEEREVRKQGATARVAVALPPDSGGREGAKKPAEEGVREDGLHDCACNRASRISTVQ